MYALRLRADEARLDDEGELGQTALAQDLAVAVLEGVDNGDDLRALCQALLLGGGDERPELVDVDDRAPVRVAGEVEVAHTDLTEVTRMVLIEVGPASVEL